MFPGAARIAPHVTLNGEIWVPSLKHLLMYPDRLIYFQYLDHKRHFLKKLRKNTERKDRHASTFDMMITSYATAVKTVLVTKDQPFSHLPGQDTMIPPFGVSGLLQPLGKVTLAFKILRQPLNLTVEQ